MAPPVHATDDDDQFDAIEAQMTPYERLHEALMSWAPSRIFYDLAPSVPSESATSCAAFELDVTNYDAASTISNSAAVGEILRVLHLMTRSGCCLAMFRSMLRDGGPVEGCVLGEWCAYCGGTDRSLVLQLTWRGSPKALEAALFDWDDSEANTGFHGIQKAVEDMEKARGDTDATPRKRPLIQLAMKLEGLPPNDELRALLQRYTDAESRGELQLFRVTSLNVNDLDNAATESVIQSQLPIVVNDDPWSRRQWAIEAPTSEGEAWSPSSTLLARGNVTSLRVRVDHHREEQATECDRLHEVLQSQPTRLKELHIEYEADFENDPTCDELSRALGDALFSGQSALQLERLRIKGHLTLLDLLVIIDCLRKAPASKPLRELVLEEWDLCVLQDANDEDIQPGRALAALIRRIGGIESLRIERFDYTNSDIPLADVLPLTICRELDVSVDTFTWEELAPPRDDQSALPADAKLERLVLRLSGHWDAEAIAAQAIRRLLKHVGSRLRSLSILPHSSSFQIDQETAKAVVELCPNLETLHVQYADDSFGDAFAEALATSECCRLERLSLRCRHSLASMFSLVSTLRQSTHPLSRSLRSLRLDIHEMEDDEDDMEFDEFERAEQAPGALNWSVFGMLEVNKRLRSVIIRGDHTCDWEGLEVWEIEGDTETAVALPPMRHRLATLSALRRYNLPRDFLIDAITMAGHPVARLQFGHADDSDAGRFYEGAEDF